MSFTQYYNNVQRRRDHVLHQSYGAPRRGPLFFSSSTVPFTTPIKGKLSSGINIFKPGDAAEGGLESTDKFFPPSLNFYDPNVSPVSIGGISPTGAGPVDPTITYSEPFQEPAVLNSVNSNRNNTASQFHLLDPDALTLAFRKESALGIRIKLPSLINGVTIDGTVVNNLCYVQKDYPNSTKANTGSANNYRIKLVKATSVVPLTVGDPDIAEGYGFEVLFPANDFHPSDYFQLIMVDNVADPWINNWGPFYITQSAATAALEAVGTLLIEDFITVTRVPDLFPNTSQPSPPVFPKRMIIGCLNTFGGPTMYQGRFSAFPAGPLPDRSLFYGTTNGSGTSVQMALYNPQMGEVLLSPVSSDMAPDFPIAYGYVPNSYMSYYYTNKNCPLHEIGASGVRDDTKYNIWMPAGILSSRYLYQTDWNGLTVSSGHFLDTTVSAAWGYVHAMDGIPGDPSPFSNYPDYYWKCSFVMEDKSSDIPIPKSNWILPCNPKGHNFNADADKFDPFRGTYPEQAKARDFKWLGIKGGGGWANKFTFIENCSKFSARPENSHDDNPSGAADGEGEVYSAWCEPQAQDYGKNYETNSAPYTPHISMNKTYTVSFANPGIVGQNPSLGRNLNIAGAPAATGPSSRMPLVLRRRVFIQADPAGWPLSPAFGYASPDVSGELFSIAYGRYIPQKRLSEGVILFQERSVDDELNTVSRDLGNQFVLIGVAIVNNIFQKIKELQLIPVVVGGQNFYPNQAGWEIPAGADIRPGNDPTNPGASFWKLAPGPTFLYDRLGRVAPHMQVTAQLPTNGAVVVYAKHKDPAGYPEIGPWIAGSITLTADADGKLEEFYINPRLDHLATYPGGALFADPNISCNGAYGPDTRDMMFLQFRCEGGTYTGGDYPPADPPGAPGGLEKGFGFIRIFPRGLSGNLLWNTPAGPGDPPGGVDPNPPFCSTNVALSDDMNGFGDGASCKGPNVVPPDNNILLGEGKAEFWSLSFNPRPYMGQLLDGHVIRVSTLSFLGGIDARFDVRTGADEVTMADVTPPLGSPMGNYQDIRIINGKIHVGIRVQHILPFSSASGGHIYMFIRAGGAYLHPPEHTFAVRIYSECPPE